MHTKTDGERCLYCEGVLGRNDSVKVINGVAWKLHRCLVRDCANEFNKLSPKEQQKLVARALERRQRQSALQQGQFSWKEAILSHQ